MKVKTEMRASAYWDREKINTNGWRRKDKNSWSTRITLLNWVKEERDTSNNEEKKVRLQNGCHVVRWGQILKQS